MEQQLINCLMKLLAKAGGGSLIKDLIQQVDQNRNPKVWTAQEIEAAIPFVNRQIENFSTAEANAVIESLQKKYGPSAGTIAGNRPTPGHEVVPDTPGVHGLI